MSRMKIGKDAIICRAAQMANESGEQSISLKLLAQDLGIQPPSLYYYFKSLDDLKREPVSYTHLRSNSRSTNEGSMVHFRIKCMISFFPVKSR